MTLEERFWSKVDKSGECWVWMAAHLPKGYGIFYVAPDSRAKLAHRVSYGLVFGSIPEGMFVCHHCDNPPCVNPGHLFLGTPGDNMHDMDGKGRNPKRARGVTANRKVAPEGTAWCYGHQAFLPAVEFGKSARRWNGLRNQCRTCKNTSERKRYSRKKGLNS